MATQATQTAQSKEREKTYDELQSEVARLREDLSSLRSTITDIASSEARAASERLRDGAERLRARGEEAVERVRTRAHETMDTQVRPTIQEHPLSSVLVSFGLGFVIGSLLRR